MHRPGKFDFRLSLDDQIQNLVDDIPAEIPLSTGLMVISTASGTTPIGRSSPAAPLLSSNM